jgi:polyhydroxybutyrate depolymerase
MKASMKALATALLFGCLFLGACGGSRSGAPPAPGAAPDPAVDASQPGGSDASSPDSLASAGPGDAPGEAGPPRCVRGGAIFPDRLDFPGAGDDGEFDFSMAKDPAGARVWASYSGVDRVAGRVLVSTRLAYSDDRGATWCDAGVVINAWAREASAPPQVAGKPAYWNHEVSKLVFDPGAPAAERWKLLWNRYLLAESGAAEERQWANSWIGLRAAASPLALASAPERKLFAGAAYTAAPALAAYNDARLGPPEVRLDQLAPALQGCVAFSEPGALATADALFVALLCGGSTPDGRAVILVRLPHATGKWEYVGRLLGAAEAKALDPAFDGFSAPELYLAGGEPHLLVSPTARSIYKGCVGYEIASLGSAVLRDRDGDGQPDPRFRLTGTTPFSGLCAYDPAAEVGGVIYGEAHWNSPPTFRLFRSGRAPTSAGAGPDAGAGSSPDAGAGPGADAPPGDGCTPRGAPGDVRREVPGFAGRPYDLRIPAGHDGCTPLPVVVAIHGGGSNAEEMRKLTCPEGDLTAAGCLTALADRERFAVVFPNGTSNPGAPQIRTFNAGGGQGGYECVSGVGCKSNVDDVGYFAALLDDLGSAIPVDPRRVFATGLSNGAAMSHRLACALADRFAAIAPVGGGNQLSAVAPCTPSRAVSVLQIHGTEDPAWPYAGGMGREGMMYSIPQSVGGWVGRNGCGSTPSTTVLANRAPLDGTRVRSDSFGGCRDGVEVAFYSIEGGGHTWPGGWQYLPVIAVGRTSRDIDANEELWRFFARLPRAP